MQRIYTLENNALHIELLTIGASIYRFIHKSTGVDIVLGLDDVEDYLQHNDSYFSVTVGPVANRIKNAQYTLNGKTVRLEANNNGNCNHSASQGWHNKVFDVVENNEQMLVFRLDDETAELYVRYQLTDDTLRVDYDLIAKEDGVFNLTNHSYFNLAPHALIFSQELCVPANAYYPLDVSGCAQKEPVPVDEVFDYRRSKAINLDMSHPQIKQGKGLDHAFLLNDHPSPIVLKNHALALEVRTSYPVALIYSANWINGVKGKNGVVYQDNQALCIECQYPVNDINFNPQTTPTLVKKGAHYQEYISFSLKNL